MMDDYERHGVYKKIAALWKDIGEEEWKEEWKPRLQDMDGRMSREALSMIFARQERRVVPTWSRFAKAYGEIRAGELNRRAKEERYSEEYHGVTLQEYIEFAKLSDDPVHIRALEQLKELGTEWLKYLDAAPF